MVHLAGMIGLIPYSMSLTDSEKEFSQCLKNLDQVMEVVKTSSKQLLTSTIWLSASVESQVFQKIFEEFSSWKQCNSLFKVVQANVLPRNASVEIQILAHSPELFATATPDDDDDSDFAIFAPSEMKYQSVTEFHDEGTLLLEYYVKWNSPAVAPVQLVQVHVVSNGSGPTSSNLVKFVFEKLDNLLRTKLQTNVTNLSRVRIFHTDLLLSDMLSQG
jgi:enamine deaminase RidA (YjgF/YER057c/UK114 family)